MIIADLGAGKVEIWADVDVKHSAPLGVRSLDQEVADTCERAMADRILVTGDGTGKGVDLTKLARVKVASTRPVLVASGATLESLPALGEHADGVIVGSALVSALTDGVGAVRSLTEELAVGVRQKVPAT